MEMELPMLSSEQSQQLQLQTAQLNFGLLQSNFYVIFLKSLQKPVYNLVEHYYTKWILES